MKKVTLYTISEQIQQMQKQMATKEDIKDMATKEDLKQMATKEDIKDMATKEDLKQMEERNEKQHRKIQEDLQTLIEQTSIDNIIALSSYYQDVLENKKAIEEMQKKYSAQLTSK